jgi:large subunit ribosomal protein L13Ae
MVIPDALRQQRLKPHRRFCDLGRLMSECGWKHKDLVAKLEAKRMYKSAAFWTAKQKKLAKKESKTVD